MEHCDDCVEGLEVCDFCKHYEFNPGSNGQYTGDGFCWLLSPLKDQKDPCDVCENFYCRYINSGFGG